VNTAIDLGDPVSAWLEADLRKQVRERGLVVWLDADNRYSTFVDRLIELRATGDLPYHVCGFRGSFLALMIELEPLTAGTDRPTLVVHVPGFNQETVRQTPLLELFAAGKMYQKALDTLVTEAAAGDVRPDRIAAFLANPGLTLASADTWLADLLARSDESFAARMRVLSPCTLIEDLLTAGPIAMSLQTPEAHTVLWERLAAGIGMPTSWRHDLLPQNPTAHDVAFAAASWAMCVEYVDDLRRPPINRRLAGARDLPRSVIEDCREAAAHLREHQASFYERTADETELILEDEAAIAKAEDLGRIDTFRFEEDRVLDAALAALSTSDWDAATAWAHVRVEPDSQSPRLSVREKGEGRGVPQRSSFWVRRDVSRRAAWQLVESAARLGQAIRRAGNLLNAHDSLEGAVEAYVERGAAVDRAHRHLEQHRAALLQPQIPVFEILRARIDDLRTLWRGWADAWSRDFTALCRTRGFLPGSAHQQRTLFEEVVRPLTQDSGITALFLIDALRFEMAEELFRELEATPGTKSRLDARLAELPTVTSVGMNALAPVAAGGRLRPTFSGGPRRQTQTAGGEAARLSAITGFSTGEYKVSDPESRQRAMHARVGGTACPWLKLDEVVDRDGTSLRRGIAHAKLVVVHSRTLDDAGESGVGPTVFDQVLQKLRAAWTLLREAGVRRFVITADHGFLLDTGSPSTHPYGRRVDPKQRYVFWPEPVDHPGKSRVALSDLGYENAPGYLMFPETTSLFATTHPAAGFVHGGNSLQERVIPVLTLVHRSAAGGSSLAYSISAMALDGVSGMHCIEATVRPATPTLDFGTPGELELALRALDAPEVQVELCQTRRGARLVAGAIRATVGVSFELFFRLTGPHEARVLVELHHQGGEGSVAPRGPETRFTVTATAVRQFPEVSPSPIVSAAPQTLAWLTHVEPDVRQVFAHLERQGAITEDEVAAVMGGARGARQFARKFEDLAAKAPYVIRIAVVAGVKRYVREENR
jgi:hypothetical protein